MCVISENFFFKNSKKIHLKNDNIFINKKNFFWIQKKKNEKHAKIKLEW